MSSLSTLPKGDSAWLLRKAIERIMEQVSVLETNIGSSTTGNSANTEIIFNDNGTLRGDAGLVYNKTTDALTVAGLVTAGSATITGDLTVDTSTLKVDSTNDRVGIVQATPLYPLHLVGEFGLEEASSGNGTKLRLIGDATKYNFRLGKQLTATNTFEITPSTAVGGTTFSNPVYTVTYDGIHTFLDGAGGTRMTLNSTGLGIGVAPVTDCKLTVRGGSIFDRGVSGGSPQLLLSLAASSGGNFGQISNTGTRWALGFGGTLTTVGTEALVWDSSGNVGIGNTPTTAWRAGARALQVGVSKYVSLHEQSNGSTNLAFSNYESAANVFSYTTGDAPSRYAQINGAHQWYSAAAGTINTVITFGDPKMTLDASGNLLVGTTATNASLLTGFVAKYNSGESQFFIGHPTATVTGTYYEGYSYNGSLIGSITQNGTTGVLYNTSSDYRLKESVKPISGGLARVNALKPSVYNWKSDGLTGEGFLAHELAEVVPFAVSGEKDAVNADGTIKSQGIDMSRIVPILVAAIQELTAEVNALKNA